MTRAYLLALERECPVRKFSERFLDINKPLDFPFPNLLKHFDDFEIADELKIYIEALVDPLYLLVCQLGVFEKLRLHRTALGIEEV